MDGWQPEWNTTAGSHFYDGSYDGKTAAETFKVVSVTVPSVFFAVILIFIATFSSVGNLLVSFTLCRRRYLMTPSNKLVLSLTTSNFFFSFLILPFMVVSGIKKKWLFGSIWCSLSGCIILLVLAASLLTLSVISCDRFYAVVHPLKYPLLVTNYRVNFVLLICWLLAACFSLLPLFGVWSHYSFYHAQMSCLPPWRSSRTFTISWVSCCLIFPYTVMILSYCRMMSIAKTKSVGLGHKSSQKFSELRLNELTDAVDPNSEERLSKADTYPSVKEHAGSCKKMALQVVVTDNDGSSYTCTQDSGIVMRSASDINNLENTCVHSPFEILDEVDPHFSSSRYPHNKKRFHDDSSVITNPEKANTSSSNMNSNNCGMSTLHVPSDKNYRSSAKKMRMEYGRRKSSSFQEAGSPQVSPSCLSRHDSLINLRGSLRSRSNISCTSSRITRNPSRASVWSRSSIRSLLTSRSRTLSYSAIHYYGNQKKALFTLFCIMGILLITLGPFVAVLLYEAAHKSEDEASVMKPLSPDWLVSLTTTLCFLTCLYYPLLYGFWNRTVRKEIKCIVCGTSRIPATRRTRILSLATHIKDLGLSPRITAALMHESAVAATVVRPMKLKERTKSRSSSLSLEGAFFKTRKRSSTQKSSDVIHPACNKGVGIRRKSRVSDENKTDNTTSACETKDSGMRPDIHGPVREGLVFRSTNFGLREREQPGGSLLKLDSEEVLQSEILMPALLYSRPHAEAGVVFKKYVSNVLESRNSSIIDVASCSKICTSLCDNPGYDMEEDSEDRYAEDVVAGLSGGRLQSSDLIHLQAGEPIKIKRWEKSQIADFFAQTLAFELMEDFKGS